MTKMKRQKEITRTVMEETHRRIAIERRSLAEHLQSEEITFESLEGSLGIRGRVGLYLGLVEIQGYIEHTRAVIGERRDSAAVLLLTGCDTAKKYVYEAIEGLRDGKMKKVVESYVERKIDGAIEELGITRGDLATPMGQH